MGSIAVMISAVGNREPVRWRVLLAALIIAGLQLAALTHLVGHASNGDNKHCSVCLAAGDAGTAMPASALVLPDVALRACPVFAPAQPAPSGARTARYQARAPPVSV